MDRSIDERNPILQIAGVPLPSYLDACRCGGRTVDVYGFLHHSNLRARCTTCEVWYRDWIDGAILGRKDDRRAKRFVVSESVRFAIFRRDKFCCVHCGRPAPRAGDAFAELRAMLVQYAGSERALGIAREAHAATCISCGQLLPGILQSVPYELYATLPGEAKDRVWHILARGRLTIDHLIPHSLLDVDGVVVGTRESEAVCERLLVTSCVPCNRGRRATLERWDELEAVIRHRILPAEPRDSQLLGLARQIYFRARLWSRRRVG